jgi:hypothetical protein
MLDTPDSLARLPSTRLKYELGSNFIISNQHVQRGDRTYYWPRLYFVMSDADELDLIECGVLEDYYFVHSRFKHKWRRNTALALGLLTDYTIAKLRTLSEQQRAAGDETLERLIMIGFAEALLHGTVPKDPSKRDPLGLRWKPKGKDQTGVLLTHLSGYLVWLGSREETSRWRWFSDSHAQPTHPAAAMRMASELAIRRKTSFLAHLKSTESRPRARHVLFSGVLEPRKESTVAPLSFPTKYVAPFLYEAFDFDDDAERTAGTISAMLFAGGLRSSEPLHTYVSDVQFTSTDTFVFLHHPDWGRVTGPDGRRITRREYLGDFGLIPRHLDYERNHAGWKGLADDDVGTIAYWLPIPALKQRVSNLLRHYLRVTRPGIMALRPKGLRDHPFLFVSPRASEHGEVGDPYTLVALRDEWKRAVKWLAVVKDDPALKHSKALGTSPHGARHHYGRYLKSLNVPGEIIMRAMHHRDFKSHLVYGRLSPAEMNAVLQNAVSTSPAPTPEMSSFLGDFHSYNNVNQAQDN